jgi:allophanate hydrolase subunit 2
MMRVLSILGSASIQGAPDFSGLHRGIPPGGALLLPQLIHANNSIKNPWNTCCLEVTGRVILQILKPICSFYGKARNLKPETTLALESGPEQACYLAIPGGFQKTRLSRGTLLLPASTPPPSLPKPDLDHTLSGYRLIAGPDPLPDALPYLLSQRFQLTQASRHGYRLSALRSASSAPSASLRLSGPSSPVLPGAIQLPPSGELLVLGPDGPVTGGYPVVAVLKTADRYALFARKPGESVRLWVVE